MYKEVRMLILNTYVSPIIGNRFNIYIATGTTKWFTTFAVRYVYTQPRKLCTSYLSNWELMQRVSAKELVKVGKYEVV